MVLRKTVVYCRELARERRALVREVEGRGGSVGEGCREKVVWEGVEEEDGEGGVNGEGVGSGDGETGRG